jgi:hypothetical protein
MKCNESGLANELVKLFNDGTDITVYVVCIPHQGLQTANVCATSEESEIIYQKESLRQSLD